MIVTVSRHAYKRIKERMGIKGKQAKNRIQQAWDRGRTGDNPPPELIEYIVWRKAQANGPAVYRIYNGVLFCFTPEGHCMTVIKIDPVNYSK